MTVAASKEPAMFCDCDRAAIADHCVVTRVDASGPVEGFYVCRHCARAILTMPSGFEFINAEDGKGNIIATYRPGEFDAITSPDPDCDC